MNEDYAARDHGLRDIDLYARTKYRMTIDWLRELPVGSTLANVGCGSGVFNEMAVDAGFVVAGYEPDPAAYQLALQHLPSHDCTVEPVGLHDIPTDDTSSAVVMHDVLEHLDDEDAAVGQLRRIVAPDGRVVISVPAMPSLFGLHDEMLGHFRRYTRQTLRRALEPSFEIVRLRAFGFAFIPLTLYYSRWRRRPYPLEHTADGGFGARLVQAVCGFERRVALPIGTSLMCEARPRRGA
ncbi:MAG TPA: class I SAM-dependent methyltransferase [Acidimicrobiia bacterium]